MAAPREVEFGVLNITAEPHKDPRVYESLLTKVAHQPVPFWGHQFGAITAPEQWDPGLLGGTIHIWTELDPDKPQLTRTRFRKFVSKIPKSMSQKIWA